MSTPTPKNFRIRSFVRRDGRRTAAQDRAYAALAPHFVLGVANGLLDHQEIFGRDAPRLLEIGFGSGVSLIALAKANPDKDFIGVETHKPGIGALLLGIETHTLTNLRVYYADVIDVLEQCIPDNNLDGIQIFFPDPWQKRRHHMRRLIQPDFIKLVVRKLKEAGTLHLATDWDDYSKHMLHVVSQEEQLVNLAGINQFAERSPYRPVLTKFERRATREGRKVWELQLQKQVRNDLDNQD